MEKFGKVPEKQRLESVLKNLRLDRDITVFKFDSFDIVFDSGVEPEKIYYTIPLYKVYDELVGKYGDYVIEYIQFDYNGCVNILVKPYKF